MATRSRNTKSGTSRSRTSRSKTRRPQASASRGLTPSAVSTTVPLTAPPTVSRAGLAQLRQQIDLADEQIVRLLNRRARLTEKIGRLKGGAGVYVAEREQEVLKRLAAVNDGPLTHEALAAIYREVMSAALALEKSIKVAYFGKPWSYTHLASLKRFGSQIEHVAIDSISEVFVEVEKERIDYGVVPVENSSEGVITHTLDMFIESNVQICAEIVMKISHCLLSNAPLNKIRRVYSNPAAFGQCRRWLAEHLPAVTLTEVSSTSRAAEMAARHRDAAAIASSLSAQHYGLRIAANAIEDAADNVTRFLVISSPRTAAPPTGRPAAVASAKRRAGGNAGASDSKTSIMFSISDRVGALHDLLAPFKWYKINLTKIESRPSRRQAWDYYFFVDMLGHVEDPAVVKVLEVLRRDSRFLKILGSYPVDVSGRGLR